MMSVENGQFTMPFSPAIIFYSPLSPKLSLHEKSDFTVLITMVFLPGFWATTA
jgi:hypothetical protein